MKVSSVTGTATEYINFSTLLNDYRKTTRRPLSTDNDLRWNWLMLDSISMYRGLGHCQLAGNINYYEDTAS